MQERYVRLYSKLISISLVALCHATNVSHSSYLRELLRIWILLELSNSRSVNSKCQQFYGLVFLCHSSARELNPFPTLCKLKRDQKQTRDRENRRYYHAKSAVPFSFCFRHMARPRGFTEIPEEHQENDQN